MLVDKLQIPERKYNKSFLLLIDHAFRIKGKGAIITGTVV
jgi:selenocysteine-specific translation elongation factor